jgi:hypothetical protein
MPNEAEPKLALPLDEVAAAARAIAAERALPARAARLVATLQAWAQPSLVICIRRDPAAETGFRLVPELTSGPVPPGTERSLAKLVDESPPGSLDKPTLVRHGDEIPGFKVRDSWIVPWSHAETSGFLLLRGIPGPYPANLGDAAALAALPIWPLVAAEVERLPRLERLAAELGRATEALGAEAASTLERVRAERARVPEQPSAPATADAALNEARESVTQLEEKIVGLEKALATADAECEFAHGEAKQAKADLKRVDGDRRMLQERADVLDKAATAASSERDKLRAETSQLWPSLQSLQREKAALDERCRAAERAAEEAAAGRAAGEAERDEARAVAATALEGTRAAEARARDAESKAGEAEERAQALSERWEETVGSLRAAMLALRRTPFVPPTLRVSFAGAESAIEADEPATRPPHKGRVLFIDRDMAALDALAEELEAAGVEVLIAHYPEEVGFFLKTPDSRRITAVVCDVMAFRADQDLLDLFRAWRHDLPNLSLFLSFKADNPPEAERAQRVPVVLAAGYLPRPLDRQAVLDVLATIAKRQGAPAASRAPKG